MLEHKRQNPYFDEEMNADHLSASKRYKSEISQPSSVVYVRSLPNDISEKEVLTLAIPFGMIENALITKTGHAMLEFNQLESATNMVNYYELYSPPVIRGTDPISVQYSKHAHLTTTSKRALLAEIIANANRTHQTLASTDSNARKVLWMQITNSSNAPLGYAPFYQVLYKFGQILRIVTFKSGLRPQAFIEFAHAISTDVAKHQLDGCSFVTGGICRTNYSHMETLEVHQESQYCRDFTKNPLFLSTEPASFFQYQLQQQQQLLLQQQQQQQPPLLSQQHQAQLQQPWMGGLQCGPSVPATSPGGTPTCEPVPFMHPSNTGLPSVQQLASLDAQTLMTFAGEVTQALAIVASREPDSQAQQLQTRANNIRQMMPLVQLAGSGPGFFDFSGGNGVASGDAVPTNTGASPVLLVSQLNAEEITPDILFTLFGVYGDVQRVKILYNKKDSALIQFADANQANLALQHLHGVPLLGRPLHCQASRHLRVTPAGPNEAGGGESGDLTRDYTGSRLHRFRTTAAAGNSRNLQNICAPNAVLHVSGLPEEENDSPARLAELFHRLSGVAPKSVKAMDRDRRMALVEYSNLADAVNALVRVDAYQIRPNARIRVSFSKCASSSGF